ncbi:MAG: hypothetical protein COB42_05835 [Sulfurimonas sp.]|nr:MAG: hypothetical protein COB42_05835 [Sulfurimonas sp.]
MSIDEIEKKITFLNKILLILKEESKSDEEFILKKYVELESIPKLKLAVQEKGIRTPRGTIYQSNDLSAIIQSKPDNINIDIIQLAHKIFKSNSRVINKLYN